MRYEVERKFHVDDLTAVEERLHALDAEFHEEKVEEDTYFVEETSRLPSAPMHISSTQRLTGKATGGSPVRVSSVYNRRLCDQTPLLSGYSSHLFWIGC
jgi:hypothetical protein